MLNRGGNSPFIRVITGVAFTSIALLIALDLISDGGEGASLVHLLLGGGILVIALLGAGLAFRSLRRTRAELSEARAEAVKWREEHSELLRGLSAAVGINMLFLYPHSLLARGWGRRRSRYRCLRRASSPTLTCSSIGNGVGADSFRGFPGRPHDFWFAGDSGMDLFQACGPQ